jgi:hypothetical protein
VPPYIVKVDLAGAGFDGVVGEVHSLALQHAQVLEAAIAHGAR